MSPSQSDNENAARALLKDVNWLLGGTTENRVIENYRHAEPELAGERVVSLLDQAFSLLDPNNDGISREELVTALTHPQDFSVDQYAMLKLIAKYFDTIINLADDQPGEETVISHDDVRVLGQFLLTSELTLSELHQWIAISNNTATENDIGPPPVSKP